MYAQLPRPVVARRIGKQLLFVATVAFLLAPVARAQDTLLVTVKTDSGKPLPESLVMVSKYQLRAASDSAGIAKLAPIARDTFTLDVRRIGYQHRRVSIADPTLPITVVLKRALFELAEVCLTYAQPAITLTFDSALAVGGATVIARVKDGSFEEVDSMNVARVIAANTPPVLSFARERPGTYDIDVTASGYERWSRSGVRLKKVACHVEHQNFEVRLRPKR
jgi:hypothetical protein